MSHPGVEITVIEINARIQHIHKSIFSKYAFAKQNTASKSMIELPQFFIALFLIAGFAYATEHVFEAIGRPLDSEKDYFG